MPNLKRALLIAGLRQSKGTMSMSISLDKLTRTSDQARRQGTREARSTPTAEDLITPRELALRLRLSLGTINNHLGSMDARCGVVRFGGKCTRINWPVFWAKLEAGEINIRAKE
jgi:hypothetical protein